MKWASVSRTLFRPFSFFRQMANNSGDSGLARVHDCGGDRNRSQFRQNDTDARLEILRPKMNEWIRSNLV